MRRILATVLASLAYAAAEAATRPVARPAPALPSDAEIRRILTERVADVSGGRPDIGIVVGIVGPEGRRVIAHPDGLVGGSTAFELGSVGKVLTGLLLADMVERRELRLEDPAQRWLPGWGIPSRGGRAITLVDLATHTSGLPFMPDAPGGVAAPFSARDLRSFLAGHALRRDPGREWDYSNLGYWLLGEALAARGGADFDRLLRTRVLAPLRLRDTGAPAPGVKARIAVGHDASGEPAAALSTLPVYALMPAAGAWIYSTVGDLGTLLSAALGHERSELSAAIALAVATRRPTGHPGEEQALGWTVLGGGSDTLVFRDGGTLGSASAIAWDPARRVGVAVLSNQVASVADIARHLLRPDFPLEHPVSARHVEVHLDAAVLAGYVGRYEAPGEGVFTITLADDHLSIESPDDWGLPALRIRPESTTAFFASELPLRVVFEMDGHGRATGILVYPPRGQKPVAGRRAAEP